MHQNGPFLHGGQLSVYFPTEHMHQLYFLTIFLNCISQVYFSSVFLKCISQVYFSTVFLKCSSQVYLSSVFLKCKHRNIPDDRVAVQVNLFAYRHPSLSLSSTWTIMLNFDTTPVLAADNTELNCHLCKIFLYIWTNSIQF